MRNLTSTLSLAAFLAGFASPVSLAADGVDEIVDTPTHAQLLQRQAKQKAEIDRVRAQRPSREAAAATPRERKPGDLVGRSTVLSYGGNWTIVPKGAVLHVPGFLRTRVDVPQQGTFVAWSDFYAKNRGWIHLQTVKMEQARGEKEMPEGLAEAYSKIGRVVVAVCHGGPISLRPATGGKAAPAAASGTGPVPVSTP
jgi:hypothetical protein